jgi:hypothetical protein
MMSVPEGKAEVSVERAEIRFNPTQTASNGSSMSGTRAKADLRWCDPSLASRLLGKRQASIPAWAMIEEAAISDTVRIRDRAITTSAVLLAWFALRHREVQ